MKFNRRINPHNVFTRKQLDLGTLLAVAIVACVLMAGCGWWDDDGGDDSDANVESVESTSTRSDSETGTATERSSLEPTATTTATPTPATKTAQDYLDNISEEWSATDSVHFTLDVDGANYLDAGEQLEFRGAEGDLARPSSADVEARIYGGILEFDVNLIFIDDDAYMTNFLTGNWERAPQGLGFNPALLFSDTEGIGAVLQDLEDPEVVGTESIDGRQTRHITGTVSGAAIDDLVAGQLTGDRIRVDVWMDTETDELLRLVLTETEGDPDDRVTWELDFTDHNVPVEIERPNV